MESTLGDRIKSIRLEKGYTMEDFGKLFNTSKGTVNNWEKSRNNPNKENLKLIADLGNISVNELLYGPLISFTKNRANSIISKYNVPRSKFEPNMDQQDAEITSSLYIDNINYKDLYIDSFIELYKRDNSLTYEFVASEKFENEFLNFIGVTPTISKDNMYEYIQKTVRELYKKQIEISNSEKYKMLYDPWFEQQVVDTLYNEFPWYQNEYEADTIAAYYQIEKDLNKVLDKEVIDRRYSPVNDYNAYCLASELTRENIFAVKNYFDKDQKIIKRYSRSNFTESDIRDGLSYEEYSELINILEECQMKIDNKVSELYKNKKQ